jgi:hypothetical protein
VIPPPDPKWTENEARWYASVVFSARVAWDAAVARSRARGDVSSVRSPSMPARPQTTATPATTQPSAASYSGGCGSGYVHDLIVAAFPEVAAWALFVANRESHCEAGAYNGREGCGGGGHASGIFQLCWPMHSRLLAQAGCSSVFDAACNVKMARILYDENGRGPWGG